MVSAIRKVNQGKSLVNCGGERCSSWWSVRASFEQRSGWSKRFLGKEHSTRRCVNAKVCAGTFGTLEEQQVDQCGWTRMSGKEDVQKECQRDSWDVRYENCKKKNALSYWTLRLLYYSYANKAFWHLWDLVVGVNTYSSAYHVSTEWRVLLFSFPGISSVEMILKRSGYLC